jgi:hypothetical protein
MPTYSLPIFLCIQSTPQYQGSLMTRYAIDAAVEGLGEEVLEDAIFQVLYMG